MRPSVVRVLPIVLLLVIAAAPALAQSDEQGRWALGVGGGIVKSGDFSDSYLMASLRGRIGESDPGEKEKGSVYGFWEPEFGYWSSSNNGFKGEDMMFGVNLGGAVRVRNFEYWVAGGIDMHMLDVKTPNQKVDDDVMGANAQFGFDIHFNDTISLFAAGRFDLLQESDEQKTFEQQHGGQSSDQQSKAYLGIRFHF